MSSGFPPWLRQVFLNGTLGAETAAEVARRARARALTANELRVLLLARGLGGPGVDSVRRTALSYVAQELHLTTSILSMYAQSVRVPAPQVNFQTIGAGSSVCHEALASFEVEGRTVTTGWHRAATKKAAQQHAELELLAELADGETPADPSNEGPASADAAPRDPYVFLDSDQLLDVLTSTAGTDPPELIAHMELRARSGLLTMRLLHTLLFSRHTGAWEAARLAALDAVAQTPGAAATLLREHARRTTAAGAGGRPARGGAHDPGGDRQGIPRPGSAEGSESACVEQVRDLADLSQWTAHRTARAEHTGLLTLFDGREPLLALREFAQLGGVADLIYRQATAGTLPVRVTASCTFRGHALAAPGQGASPQVAQNRAARALLLILNGMLTQPSRHKAPDQETVPPQRRDEQASASSSSSPPADAGAGQGPDAEPTATPACPGSGGRLREAAAAAPAPALIQALLHGAGLAFDTSPQPGQSSFVCLEPSDLVGAGHLTVESRTVLLPGGEVSTVKGLRLDLLDVVHALAQPAADTWSSSAQWWAGLVRLALTLIENGQVYPALAETSPPGCAPTWRVGPWTDDLRTQVARLADELVQLPRCLHQHGEGEAAHDPVEELGVFLDAVAERFVPAPGFRYLLGDIPFAARVDYEQRPPGLQEWADGLEENLDQEALPTLVVRIPAPRREQARLRATLQLRDGSAEAVDALQIWDGQVVLPGFGPDLRRRTARALRRCARAFAPLGPLGAQARPSAFLLSQRDAAALRGPVGPELAAAGITVDWADDWAACLDSHVVVGTGTPSPVGAGRVGLGEILDRRWRITVDGVALTDEEMDELAAQALPAVRLHNRWILLDDIVLARLRTRTLPSIDTRQGRIDALTGSVTIDGITYACTPADGLADLIEELRSPPAAPLSAPASLTGVTLHPHQLSAVSWLQRLTDLGFGALLGDEMGLGKTITALAFHQTRQPLSAGPTLVVCPSGLLDNWHREIASRLPRIPVVRYHGPHRSLAGVRSQSIVLTSYALMCRDNALLAAWSWGLVVADEAQKIKNYDTIVARLIRRLPADARVALTGTPVENATVEAWAILDWLCPDLVASRREFMARYARPLQQAADPAEAEEARQRLLRLIQPFLLRRLKSDPGINLGLPGKTETTHTVPLSAEQTGLYEALLRDTQHQLRACPDSPRRGQLVLRIIDSHRKIANSPAHYLDEDPRTLAADPDEAARRAPKLAALFERLDDIRQRGENALVFTAYAVVGDLLIAYLTARGFRPLLHHGSLTTRQRISVLDTFGAGKGTSSSSPCTADPSA